MDPSAAKTSLKKTTFDFISVLRHTFPVLLLIASVVGVGSGFIAVGFIKLIDLAEKFFFGKGKEIFSFLGIYYVILIPALGGLLVGPLVTFLAPEAKGHGVPEVLQAIVVRRGRIRPIVVLVKAVASALALGSGASVGREGPIVQVGSALGSTTAQLFRLNEPKTRNLIACGAAGGIAAVFNAPIAGVMFALEVILRDFGAKTLSTVVVAAVSSSIVSRIFLGESPAFIAPAYSLRSPFEIFIYFGLGILSALAALSFVFTLYQSEEIFERWKFPEWLKASAGGLLIGCMGLYFPQIFGSGLGAIQEALHGNLALHLLILLIFIKIIATSVSLGSGSSGGVFAPALFIGSVLGGAVGKIAAGRFPFPVGHPGAYAIVGMASVFAAAAHAPVTAILIVFEMTGDYRMILPIMVSVVVATSISQFISRESIYTIKLKKRGIDIGFLEEAKVLGGLQVRDAMSTDEKAVAAAVTGSDGTGSLAEYCFPEEPLNEAAKLMLENNLTQLLVVDPGQPAKVVGVLKDADIFRTYTTISAKRSDLLGRIEHQLTQPGGTISIRFFIPSRSVLAGKAIRDLHLPEGVTLTAIKRRTAVLIPKGGTILQPRDKIWVVLISQSEPVFQQWLKDHKLSPRR